MREHTRSLLRFTIYLLRQPITGIRRAGAGLRFAGLLYCIVTPRGVSDYLRHTARHALRVTGAGRKLGTMWGGLEFVTSGSVFVLGSTGRRLSMGPSVFDLSESVLLPARSEPPGPGPPKTKTKKRARSARLVSRASAARVQRAPKIARAEEKGRGAGPTKP